MSLHTLALLRSFCHIDVVPTVQYMRALDSVVLPSLILNCGPTSTPTPHTRDPARRNAPATHTEHTPDHETDQAQDAVGGRESI